MEKVVLLVSTKYKDKAFRPHFSCLSGKVSSSVIPSRTESALRQSDVLFGAFSEKTRRRWLNRSFPGEMAKVVS